MKWKISAAISVLCFWITLIAQLWNGYVNWVAIAIYFAYVWITLLFLEQTKLAEEGKI